MTPERWQQVRQLLSAVVALPRNQRKEFLETSCGADLELRAEVESLVVAHEQAQSQFLETPVADLTSRPPSPPIVASRAGRRIGSYLVIEEIGRGGMGEVYRAVRADGEFKKEVAIKLVREGYNSLTIQERFRNERQILASLDHPNIARLIDGGTTDEGISYLVMELVEGVPIDSYCDTNKLSVTERLWLSIQVCSAVQYAHQHLVIHRDIKPRNILVTKDGVPKLLDFGIAKIIDPSGGTEATMLRPMTLEYASPEQIRGEAISTSSDVYSLVVVLYRLLTGHSPYRVSRCSPARLAEAITQEEPERPSISVQRADNEVHGEDSSPVTPEAISSTREDSPHRLQKRLRGDLDCILLKALRKEPAKRYSSVEQFAEDLRRHLEGLPIAARKGTWTYRAGKFVRRHRAAVSAASLVLIILIFGVTATVRSARIARAERAKAEKRFDDIRKLSNSLIFEIHDSIQGLPGATPSRKLLLDRALEYLDKLSQDSAGDLDLQRELAWGYQRLAAVQGDTTQSNLGQVSAAEASNRKAMALFEAVAKASPRNVTDQLNLAMAYRTRAAFDVYLPRGRAEILEAIAVTDLLMRTDGDRLEVKKERASVLLILAFNQDSMGDRLQAVETFRRVVDLRREMLQANPDYPGIRQGVAKATVLLAHEMGRFASREEAMPLMNAGLADYEALRKNTPGDPGVIRELSTSEGRRGDVELMMGDVVAARLDFRRSSERVERLAKLDPENKMLQSDVWVGKFEEGKTLAVAGRYAEALPLLIQAFQGYQALHLENDVGPGPGAMQAWIAEAFTGTHNLAEALKNYEKAAATLAADQADYDDARCDLAMVQSKIGFVLLKMGKLKDAQAEYQKALDTAKLSFSLEHVDIPALYAAADAYAGMGEAAMAEARTTKEDAARATLVQKARADYESSLSIWKHIANPSRISGNGYAASLEFRELSSRLANLPAPSGTQVLPLSPRN